MTPIGVEIATKASKAAAKKRSAEAKKRKARKKSHPESSKSVANPIPTQTPKASDISEAVCLLNYKVVSAEGIESTLKRQTKYLTVEEGSHGVLDELIFQGRNSQRTLPSIFFLYVHSSRRQRSICSAMNPAMKINQPIFQPGLVLLPGDPVHSGSGFLL